VIPKRFSIADNPLLADFTRMNPVPLRLCLKSQIGNTIGAPASVNQSNNAIQFIPGYLCHLSTFEGIKVKNIEP